MIAFRRILFPVSFSKQDRETAPFVKAMAERFHADVFLLHAAESIPAWYGPPDSMALQPALDLKGLLDERRERLIEHVSADLSGVPFRTVLDIGDPAKEIAQCIQQQKIDLVMMPTHGFGPFRRLLLGSVTAKVLHDTDCPVWTGVHTDQLWSHKQSQWRRFLCAVSEKEAPLLRWAAQFAREQSVELHGVHAVHPFAPISADDESRSLHDFLMDTSRDRLAKLQAEAGASVEIDMKFGRVADVVRDAALACEADLILIGRGVIQGMFGRLRSEAYTIIREAPCPVISI